MPGSKTSMLTAVSSRHTQVSPVRPHSRSPPLPALALEPVSDVYLWITDAKRQGARAHPLSASSRHSSPARPSQISVHLAQYGQHRGEHCPTYSRGCAEYLEQVALSVGRLADPLSLLPPTARRSASTLALPSPLHPAHGHWPPCSTTSAVDVGQAGRLPDTSCALCATLQDAPRAANLGEPGSRPIGKLVSRALAQAYSDASGTRWAAALGVCADTLPSTPSSRPPPSASLLARHKKRRCAPTSRFGWWVEHMPDYSSANPQPRMTLPTSCSPASPDTFATTSPNPACSVNAIPSEVSVGLLSQRTCCYVRAMLPGCRTSMLTCVFSRHAQVSCVRPRRPISRPLAPTVALVTAVHL